MEMKAYHGAETIKQKYLERVREHSRLDHLRQRISWKVNGKNIQGCAIGCTLEKYDHAAYETELGIPRMLAYLEDNIFESLPHDWAMEWPARFLSAVRVGSDLSSVGAEFLLSINQRNLDRLSFFEKKIVGKEIRKVIAVLKNWVKTGKPNITAARTATCIAAEKAWKLRKKAERKAERTAEAAVWTAERAAEAAWATVWTAEAECMEECAETAATAAAEAAERTAEAAACAAERSASAEKWTAEAAERTAEAAERTARAAEAAERSACAKKWTAEAAERTAEAVERTARAAEAAAYAVEWTAYAAAEAAAYAAAKEKEHKKEYIWMAEKLIELIKNK